MAIRKSMQEELVVSGTREDWLKKCTYALRSSGFSKITTHAELRQIEANYRKFMTWGTITITLMPAGNETKITAMSTANVDNIYALFRSPTKMILSKFKEGLQ